MSKNSKIGENRKKKGNKKYCAVLNQAFLCACLKQENKWVGGQQK